MYTYSKPFRRAASTATTPAAPKRRSTAARPVRAFPHRRGNMQCAKCSAKNSLNQDMLGARTKNVISMVAEEILKLNPDAKAAELAEKVLTSAGVKFKDDKKGETKDKKAEALFFM